ncbi:MAG TPA: hypothetical protein VJ184_12660, partial [Chryseolinea sp.]|nr:hypothetical protein [Chryseolinea sp.]
MLRKTAKIIGWFFGIVIFLVAGLMVYVRVVAEIDPPTPASLASLKMEPIEADSGLFKINKNWFRKSESGLYELYVEGEPFE